MFIVSLPKFQCGLCEDLFFPAKRACMSHLLEQHSGVSFKCTRCKKIFRRNDNPHNCRASKEDFYLFNQSTGAKGVRAERDLEDFMKRAESKLCVDTSVRVVRKDLELSESESESESSSSSESESENEFEKFQEENCLRDINLYELDQVEEEEIKKREEKRRDDERKRMEEKKKDEEMKKLEDERKKMEVEKKEKERKKLEDERKKMEEEKNENEKKTSDR